MKIIEQLLGSSREYIDVTILDPQTFCTCMLTLTQLERPVAGKRRDAISRHVLFPFLES